MRRLAAGAVLALCSLLLFSIGAHAQAPSGAIFTTLSDGSEVNTNLFSSKDLVYLDGGPGIGAPQTAAGLDDGQYVFQVTDPSGKTLLSTDAAACRQFVVASGIITGVVPAGGCQHATGLDQDHSAVTVQLMPFADTPNHGGVYKAWAELSSNYPTACFATVDCATYTHGFFPGFSKTDNFKVATKKTIGEFDTVFFQDLNHDGDRQAGEPLLTGAFVTWVDTLSAGNLKWTDPNNSLQAHVEAPEVGTHQIQISSQAACPTVGAVEVQNSWVFDGPGTVSLTVTSKNIGTSWAISVACE